MSEILDIVPLRSLVAIDDNGGFTRAAEALQLSQAAISQHVRRLEESLGRPLFERSGRTSQFTPEGEALLGHARRILQAHDHAVEAFRATDVATLAIGSTEHAAAQLLPVLTGAMSGSLFEQEIRLRLDRGARLREDLAAGRLDLAILPGPTSHPELDGVANALSIGELELTWYAAPGFTLPQDGTVPIAAFENPCALRNRAVETLSVHGLHPTVVAEAGQLAGVLAAVTARVGVALLATLGNTPEGLVPFDGLPKAEPLEFSVWGRKRLDQSLLTHSTDVLRAATHRQS